MLYILIIFLSKYKNFLDLYYIMAYERKTTRKVRSNKGKERSAYGPRGGVPRPVASPRKMTAMVPMGRAMMRKAPSKCEKALMNGSIRRTSQGKLLRVYRGKDGKMKKTYCASNLQRRGAIGAVNANRIRAYTKGGAVRVPKKVAGIRKANSACEKAFKNGSLMKSKKGQLYRMMKTKTGGMRKVYCNKNLTRRGINTTRYGSATKLPNITNRLRVVSPARSMSSRRSGSASTTASNIEMLNMLHRALNMVPVPARVSPARVSPARVSPARVSPARVSPARVSPDANRLRKNFGKHAAKVAAAMKRSGRPSTNYSKTTGKLKVAAKKK
jgi:hypothetical protein